MRNTKDSRAVVCAVACRFRAMKGVVIALHGVQGLIMWKSHVLTLVEYTRIDLVHHFSQAAFVKK